MKRVRWLSKLVILFFTVTLLLIKLVYYDLSFNRNNGDDYSKSLEIKGSLVNISIGIVMCVGNDPSFINGALYTIHQLRNVWESSLPVSIIHCNELYSDSISKFTYYSGVRVKNVCRSKSSNLLNAQSNNVLTRKQIRRYRGWFCKPLALVTSDFDQTMIIDTDVLWLKDPSKLFRSPNFKSNGALFFRDRFLFESKSEKDGLRFYDTLNFIIQESKLLKSRKVRILSSNLSDHTSMVIMAAREFKNNGVNYFWRHGIDKLQYPAIRHVQVPSSLLKPALIMNK